MRQARYPIISCLMLPLICLSCATVDEADAPDQGVPCAQPGGQETRPVDDGTIALRTALVPGDEPQPVRIHLIEKRETTGEHIPTVTYELDVTLAGTLKRTKQHPDGSTEAEIALSRVTLSVRSPDRPDAEASYDSARDKPNTGNPLADVMTYVAGAKLDLKIGPSGRLRSLSGFDHQWGRANILLAPPGLLTVQWLFRDVSMTELVGEALFPPMPASPVRPGDKWDIDVPANIPLVARLKSRLRSEVAAAPAGQDNFRSSTVTIKSIGKIEPAPPLLAGIEPAIQAVIKTGQHTITQTVTPAEQSLEQQSTRTIDAQLTLTPPTGPQRLTMNIKQTRTLESRRGKPAH